jgi:Uma2 family endonuclease
MQATILEPRPHLWTDAEYYKMAELGWFKDQKVKLIDGEVFVVSDPDTLSSGSDKSPVRRWTREEFYQMLDLGWFQDHRVELIDGEVIDMPAQKNFHALSIKLTDTALCAIFGPQYWVRVQMTLDLSPLSSPDPDLAVVAGSPRSHAAENNPTSSLLVVEVSETSLWYDRNRKAHLYAAAEIDDYWIVNLINGQLEVYRDPVADSTQPFGFRYAARTLLDPVDVVSPLAAPQGRITVTDLLP